MTTRQWTPDYAAVDARCTDAAAEHSDDEPALPRCDQCDRTIWCEDVHQGGYVFCSVECRDAGDVGEPDDEEDELAGMTLAQRRAAIGGEYGGDGPDD